VPLKPQDASPHKDPFTQKRELKAGAQSGSSPSIAPYLFFWQPTSSFSFLLLASCFFIVLSLKKKGAYWFRLKIRGLSGMSRMARWPRKKSGQKINCQRRTGSRGLIDRDVSNRTPATIGSDDSRLVQGWSNRTQG
jgi:hypothetical protein